MYSVGSLADLISGSNTPNKPTLQLKAVASLPFKTTKSSKQKTENNAKKPRTRKRKSSLGKQNAETTENKVTPQMRKLDDNNEDNEAAAKKVKTDKKQRPVKKNAKHEKINNKLFQERTIFVGNVPITANIKELKRFFSLYGVVKTVRMRGIPSADPKMSQKLALMKKKFHKARKSLQCYVMYSTIEDSLKALEANGSEFKGHHLIVDKATQCEHDQKKAIFIGNLPFDAEENDVWSLFEDCGDIMSVRLVRDKQTRMGKGFGYVNFSSADDVELALQMDDFVINKRIIRVKRCSKSGEQTKKTIDGIKNRKSPRMPKTEATETDKTMTEQQVHVADKPAQFQGSKFTDKRKKKRLNKNESKKKKISKILTSTA